MNEAIAAVVLARDGGRWQAGATRAMIAHRSGAGSFLT
jgi:hypothetical protein